MLLLSNLYEYVTKWWKSFGFAEHILVKWDPKKGFIQLYPSQAKLGNGNEKSGYFWAGALVQWLWEETRGRKVVGLNPSTVRKMDGHFFTLISNKNCNGCLKKTENKQKEAE